MTGILDQLTDAMNAAAGTVREEELRPLAPPERRPGLPRRLGLPCRPDRLAWAAPVAAAAAMVLVIGLAVSVSTGLFGPHRGTRTAYLPTAPHRFYLATGLGTWKTVVRSTATGRVVAVVPVRSLVAGESVSPALAEAGNGTFYLAAVRRGVPGEQIYRFRLTAAGHVTGFARVPGGSLRPGWAADALAASPDGSWIAVGAYYYRDHRLGGQTYGPQRADQLVVIHTATGAQAVWQGGSPAPGYRYFRVASLSWTGDGRELAVLGEWCRAASDPGGETCPRRERLAQVRAVDPAGHGGSVLGGRLLLRQSPRVPFLAQALISPDGSALTAMVLRGQVVGNPQISGFFPGNLSVERISVPGGRLLGVLYRHSLGDTSEVSSGMADPLALSADATGRNLILNGGICNPGCTNEFNGWLHDGQLVPLPPSGFAHREAAEAW
jgi:hypothetical protein